MAIQEISIDNSEQWDSIVRRFNNDTYWRSGYVKAFQLHGDGEPKLIYFESDKSLIKAINVVMKRDISSDTRFNGILTSNTYFDYATPYGYGGWIIDNPKNEDSSLLFEEYSQYCNNYNIISEFVRFHPLVENHLCVTDYYEVVPLGEVVALDLSSPELIWNNITSKNRNMIRKAIKNGVKIYQGRCPELYEVFRRIYTQTMDKDRASKYYYFPPAFYESILNDLSNNAQVFYAQIPDGTIIAASIMLVANGRMNYHLSGSLKEYSHLAPTNLLLYKAALWGSEIGCQTLFLGGGVGSGEDSLFKFKRAFYKGELPKFYIGKHVFKEDVYEKLIEIRRKDAPMIDHDSFFPAYRAGGGGEKLKFNYYAVFIFNYLICASFASSEVH